MTDPDPGGPTYGSSGSATLVSTVEQVAVLSEDQGMIYVQFVH
jgi:hypothetical protein